MDGNAEVWAQRRHPRLHPGAKRRIVESLLVADASHAALGEDSGGPVAEQAEAVGCLPVWPASLYIKDHKGV